MFLSKNYILVNELSKKMGITHANFSILKAKLEDEGDEHTFIKYGNALFIDKTSSNIPKNIKECIAMYENELTNFEKMLPVTYIKSEYGVSERELKNAGIIEGVVVIEGKKFFKFTDEFVKNMKNKILYVLNEQETNECYKKGQIEGFIKLNKDKYLTWYSKGL